MKKQVSLMTVTVLVVLSLVLGVTTTSLISGDNIFEQFNKYKDVLSLTQKYYVDDINMQKLTEAAITGMLTELDPHSTYLPPRVTKVEAERFQGSYQGVGLEIIAINDTIVVSEPMGGGPASRLGIMSNDKIVKINDTSAVGYTTSQASQRLRGPKGTKVTVSIVRSGVNEPLVYEIVRDNIALTSVDVALMLTPEVGYISVNRFSATTNTEMVAALTTLKNEGMKRLVLDLRGNPGGYMQEAVKMADLFLEGGPVNQPRKIVYTKARVPELEEVHVARSGQEYEKMPLIVMINNGSASASEIVSGAIQDWDRGLIVGETSFGKGLVQRQFDFSDGSAIRLTIARYYTPSGRLIQRPYNGKDADQYRQEAYDREETEGENVAHGKDLKVGSDSTRPKFQTNGNRTVYGGGGITPDYIVKPWDLTDATKDLLRRDVFYPFTTSYIDNQGKNLRSEYGTDYKNFDRSFEVSDELFDQFKLFVRSKDLKIGDDAFEKDGQYLKARLKAHIARTLWSDPGWFSVMLDVDPQIQKALTLFPEAQKIAGLDKPSSKKLN
jgi:carboxyl-terminal processing protease